jgi:hypothetical protein
MNALGFVRGRVLPRGTLQVSRHVRNRYVASIPFFFVNRRLKRKAFYQQLKEIAEEKGWKVKKEWKSVLFALIGSVVLCSLRW